MQVKILEHTTKPLDIIYTAARTCYSEKSPIKMHKCFEASTKKKIALIKAVVEMGHHSVLEHINVTFGIENISRACSHQLVRHRIASYSQQSQRYVSLDSGFDYVIPESIKDSEALVAYHQTMARINHTYNILLDRFEIPSEDARFVLPNACCTNITMTVNMRELIEMCKLRLCAKAQWEIRDLFNSIVFSIDNNKHLKFLSQYLMPKCDWIGWCPEGKRTCGKYEARRPS